MELLSRGFEIENPSRIPPAKVKLVLPITVLNIAKNMILPRKLIATMLSPSIDKMNGFPFFVSPTDFLIKSINDRLSAPADLAMHLMHLIPNHDRKKIPTIQIVVIVKNSKTLTASFKMLSPAAANKSVILSDTCGPVSWDDAI